MYLVGCSKNYTGEVSKTVTGSYKCSVSIITSREDCGGSCEDREWLESWHVVIRALFTKIIKMELHLHVWFQDLYSADDCLLGQTGEEHLLALEYLHLTQVSERWEPTSSHSVDKDHSVDKEAGLEGLSNMTAIYSQETSLVVFELCVTLIF